MRHSQALVTFLRIPPFFGMLLAHPQERQLPLSIAQSAACLREAGFSVEILDLWVVSCSRRRLLERLSANPESPLVVHVDSMNQQVVLDIIRALRDKPGQRKPLIATGQYAEVFPDTLLLPEGPFDACVWGEPEDTLVELCRNLTRTGETGIVPGICIPDTGGGVLRNAERVLHKDLDALPHPAYDIFDLDAYAKQSAFVPIAGPVRWGWMLSSRGCPFNCEFCSPTLRKSCGSAYRAHTPGYVADLTERLITEFGCNALAFEDDVFSLSRSRTLAIADEFIARRLSIYWTAQTHLSTLDEDVIVRMYESGCRGLCMGVESGNDEIRGRIKGNSLPRKAIEENVALLHKHGIATTLYFMIGSPGETLDQMEETLNLALSLKPMMIQLAFYTPYPGSRAWTEYLRENGREADLSHYNRFTVNLSAATRDEVLAFYQKFYRRFYLNPEFIGRFLRHRLPYTIRQNGRREWLLLLRSLAFLAIPKHGIRLPRLKS